MEILHRPFSQFFRLVLPLRAITEKYAITFGERYICD